MDALELRDAFRVRLAGKIACVRATSMSLTSGESEGRQ